MRHLSIIVLMTVRRDERIRSCLERLSQQNYPRECFSVVVIENDTAPRFGDLVRSYGFCYRIVPEPGIGNARAAGCDHFEGDILATIDADCLPALDWLSEINGSFIDDERLGVVGGIVPKLVPATWVERHQRSLAPDDQRALQYLRHISGLPYVVGANAAYRGAAVRACGGFRSCYESGSDVDIAWRIQYLGYTAALNPHMVVYHACRAGAMDVFRQFRRYAIGHVLLFRSHSRRRWVVNWYPKWGLFRLFTVRLPVALVRWVTQGDVSHVGRCYFELIEYLGIQWGAILGAWRYRTLYL